MAPILRATKYRKVVASASKPMPTSPSDEIKRVPTAFGEKVVDDGIPDAPAKGQGAWRQTIKHEAAVTTNTSSPDEIVLSNGVKIPKRIWTPLTDRMIAAGGDSTIITDEEVKNLDDISRGAGNVFSPPVLEFLAKDVPQATAGSLSRKKLEQVTAADLSVPKDQPIDNYERRRAAYPSVAEMENMTAARIFEFVNDLQEKYPSMARERVRAEEKLEEAEAKAGRDRMHLDKLKRELEEKKERRKRSWVNAGVGKAKTGEDVIMGGMEEGGVEKKGGDGEREDVGEKMDLS
ncbi:MAG: hypothetical protein M1816_004417 [Peltula sp. TS41687]|nr:MAG: hypothetical protein M1816_004417 [Peltula sp. TS41687]